MRDEEIGRFREQVRVLRQRMRREVSPVPGVPRSVLRVLAAVQRAGGESQPGRVADELGMTSSNVAAALRDLEAGGYLVRERDTDDARRVLLRLTPAGRAVVLAAQRERDTWLGHATAALLSTEEQRVLLAAGDLMERLAGYEGSPE